MATNSRQRLSRGERVIQQLRQLRQANWPEAGDDMVWSRKRSDGYCTTPRIMPIFLQIMDNLAVGHPLSSTYIALWCRTSDEGVLIIQHPREVAMESGFGGARAESTWLRRMRLLMKHGFIKSKPGPCGEFHYVLLINPFRVVENLREKDAELGGFYAALLSRAAQVGADDLLPSSRTGLGGDRISSDLTI
jgi:hypothetical protein